MSDIGEELRTKLLANSAVAALVGTRMYPDVLPQMPTLPALTWLVVSTDNEEHLGGSSGSAHSRVQVDAYAGTRGAANQLADKVRLAIQGKHHVAWGAIYIHGVSLASGPRDFAEEPKDASDTFRYGRSQDFRISHQETVPS